MGSSSLRTTPDRRPCKRWKRAPPGPWRPRRRVLGCGNASLSSQALRRYRHNRGVPCLPRWRRIDEVLRNRDARRVAREQGSEAAGAPAAAYAHRCARGITSRAASPRARSRSGESTRCLRHSPRPKPGRGGAKQLVENPFYCVSYDRSRDLPKNQT